MEKRYELSELIALMKRERVLEVSLGSLVVKLDPSAFIEPDLPPPPKSTGFPTHDDLLFYSSDVYETPEKGEVES